MHIVCLKRDANLNMFIFRQHCYMETLQIWNTISLRQKLEPTVRNNLWFLIQDLHWRQCLVKSSVKLETVEDTSTICTPTKDLPQAKFSIARAAMWIADVQTTIIVNSIRGILRAPVMMATSSKIRFTLVIASTQGMTIFCTLLDVLRRRLNYFTLKRQMGFLEWPVTHHPFKMITCSSQFLTRCMTMVLYLQGHSVCVWVKMVATCKLEALMQPVTLKTP